MNKVILLLGLFSSPFTFANTLVCNIIPDGNATITHTNTQVQTIDVIANSKTTRVYSRTYDVPDNRGGYKVGYCNPDRNEISEDSGMSVSSHCKEAGGTADVMFTLYVHKSFEFGKMTIAYLGDEIVNHEIGFKDCQKK